LVQDVVTLSADAILDDNLVETILLSGYSRFPVHEPNNPDAFIGLLLIKKVRVCVHFIMTFVFLPFHAVFPSRRPLCAICRPTRQSANASPRPRSSLNTTCTKRFPCRVSRSRSSPRRSQALIVSRRLIICASSRMRLRSLVHLYFTHYPALVVYWLLLTCCSSIIAHDSQTGRAHLLLISQTPGKPGGAIGVITLEGVSLLSLCSLLVLPID
jgi:hypothetical protein